MLEGQEREWLRPETIADPATQSAAERPAMYELRPLSLGEILDRTFALYRSRFWLFASISAISGSVHVVVQAISLATMHTLMRSFPSHRNILLPPPQRVHLLNLIAAPGRGVAPILPLHALWVAEARAWIAALIFFLVASLTQAATSLALSQVYLNQATSAKTALATVLPRWYRWIGIALWQAWSFGYIPLLGSIVAFLLLGFGARLGSTALTVLGGILLFAAILGGMTAGVFLYLRNTLAIPAAVVERLTLRPAMRRSKGLAAGTKGRIFVVLLIALCLYWVVAALESPLSFFILFSPRQEHYLAQAITLLIAFVGHTVVAPVALIGLTLVYFDQRVRKEALDVQLLLESGRTGAGVSESGAPPPTTSAEQGFAPLG